jgi:hypothetical protein
MAPSPEMAAERGSLSLSFSDLPHHRRMLSRILLLLALLSPFAALAQDVPPNDASLRQLLEVSELHRIWIT